MIPRRLLRDANIIERYRPQIIGFCGAPNTGKTTAREILAGCFPSFTVPIDEIDHVREAASYIFQLPKEYFIENSKKDMKIEVYGQEETPRKLLADLISFLDIRYDCSFTALSTSHKIKNEYKGKTVLLASVRNVQPIIYKKNFPSTILIEITRDDYSIVNAFDLYDRSQIDAIVNNTGSLEDFRDSLIQTIADVIRARMRLS